MAIAYYVQQRVLKVGSYWDDPNDTIFTHPLFTNVWFPITVTEGNLPLAAHNYVVYLIYVLGISVLHKCTRHFPFHYFLRTRHFRFPYVLCTRHFRFGGMTFMDSSMADMKKFIHKTGMCVA